MTNRNRNSGWLGGLSFFELARRTTRESWQDELFGQAGRMAFYHFLALFPALLVFLAVTTHVPHIGDHLKNAIQDMSGQVLPNQVSKLFQAIVEELNQHARSRVPLLPVIGGATWAALNATWALIYGLNIAFEVAEKRSKPRLALTIVGLAATLAMTATVALALILFGRTLHGHFHAAVFVLRFAEWAILVVTLLFSFSLLYRFAPNLEDARWQWSTPGAICALLLWVSATVGARIYFGRFNDYSRSYGHLNSAVMLLLWLYLSNAAVLIGGEMNSEIEKAAAGPTGAVQSDGHRSNRGRRAA
ncbi:MAG TPA: YihY/virulence factor BrkB family protein [Acidobacteriaceae bacterium]|jgi:membrane protein|nr:YihY/virulence factor BrkB family protein [Acidobacteriaceae bacterium]